MSALQQTNKTPEVTELQIAIVLRYQHGERTIPLANEKPNTLLSAAINRGFIDTEGYITRKGRALIARYSHL